MTNSQEISPKSGLTAFILCFFFGFFGIHRFYVGKIGTGILMLFTFGGLGFWMVYDLFSIVCKNFTDSQGRSIEVAKSPKAPRNVVLTFLGIYILLFGSITVLVGMSVKPLVSVSKSELAALHEGNIDQAYSYTSIGFKKAVTLDNFKKFLEAYPQLRNNVDSTFSEVQYKNNDGSVTGTLNMKDGSKIPLDIELVKEDNQWKINGINLRNVGTQETAPAPAKEAAPAPEKDAAPAADKDATPEAAQPSDQGSENKDENTN